VEQEQRVPRAGLLNADLHGQMQGKFNKTVVAGFDSSGVVFYRFSVPPAKPKEFAAMVRHQAEAHLPLPAEQMSLAWRTGRTENGQVSVSVAAGRKEQLQTFVDSFRVFEPTKILLDSEAVVKVWRELFSGTEPTAVVVSLEQRRTRVCLAENGRLTNAVNVDMGTDDFSASKTSGQDPVAAERFAQDITAVLELFGYTEPRNVPLFVLSDGSSLMEEILASLASAGLNLEAVLPDLHNSRIKSKLSAEELYEYRSAIGLGLIAMEEPQDALDVFGDLYSPRRSVQSKYKLRSPKVAGAIAGLMLVLLLAVSYAVDVAKLAAIEERLQAANVGAGYTITQRQNLIKAVARQRPDMLSLLTKINLNENEGIILDVLDFRKGQPVRLIGRALGPEQLYKFQKNLLSKNGIKDVEIRTTSKDPKSNQVKFTITFHYKHFTQKRTRA